MNRRVGESEHALRRLRRARWLLLLGAVTLAFAQQAEPQPLAPQAPPDAQPSAIAWTPETLRLIRSGDVRRGEELARDCASCHGATGVAPTRNFPSLAGQLATYTYKQLRDYKDGARPHAIMSALASTLEEQEMADLAAWYAAQDLPRGEPLGASATLRLPLVGTARAQSNVPEEIWQLVRSGDAARHIAPCMVCHGAKGEGSSIGVPALTGQTEAYLRETLFQYRNGVRTNDTYARMRLIAQELSDEEILGLAAYYSQLPPP